MKVEPLNVDVWDTDHIGRLIAAVDVAILPERRTPRGEARRHFWRTIIPAAWYSGLSEVDLFRLDRSHVDETGRVTINRSKTGKKVVTFIPPALLAQMTDDGPFWAPQTAGEQFRLEFRRIALAAGLKGSFKKLRRSSGTAAEILNPGRGHEHLANTRVIFERHYLGTDSICREPVKLPELGSQKPGLIKRLRRALGIGRKGGAA